LRKKVKVVWVGAEGVAKEEEEGMVAVAAVAIVVMVVDEGQLAKKIARQRFSN